MSHETTKAYKLASRQKLYGKYLNGRVLDVGCGQDKLICEGLTVDGWDVDQGDAQLLYGVPEGSYDCLYSSHCLEHMLDVPAALSNWSRTVKRDGHLIIVVPDYMMYEKCQWPPPFNKDHKASFSVFDIHEKERHATFYSVGQIIQMGKHAGLELVELVIEQTAFDWHLLWYKVDQTGAEAMANVVYVFIKL